jgi:Cu2+-exporting ATPase
MEHHHTDQEHDHHAHMIKDFNKCFWISLIIMIVIVVLAPMIQGLVGFEFRFNGDRYLQFRLSSTSFFYVGWPFLKGLDDNQLDSFHRFNTSAIQQKAILALLVSSPV